MAIHCDHLLKGRRVRKSAQSLKQIIYKGIFRSKKVVGQGILLNGAHIYHSQTCKPKTQAHKFKVVPKSQVLN